MKPSFSVGPLPAETRVLVAGFTSSLCWNNELSPSEGPRAQHVSADAGLEEKCCGRRVVIVNSVTPSAACLLCTPRDNPIRLLESFFAGYGLSRCVAADVTPVTGKGWVKLCAKATTFLPFISHPILIVFAVVMRR